MGSIPLASTKRNSPIFRHCSIYRAFLCSLLQSEFNALLRKLSKFIIFLARIAHEIAHEKSPVTFCNRGFILSVHFVHKLFELSACLIVGSFRHKFFELFSKVFLCVFAAVSSLGIAPHSVTVRVRATSACV